MNQMIVICKVKLRTVRIEILVYIEIVFKEFLLCWVRYHFKFLRSGDPKTFKDEAACSRKEGIVQRSQEWDCLPVQGEFSSWPQKSNSRP